MKVVSTSALPIDLAAQVTAALPGTVVEVPAAGHVAIAGLDLSDADALVCLLLDRIDAALLAIPVMYYMMLFTVFLRLG